MSNDPFQEREAEKYESPIPSREFILDLLSKRTTVKKLHSYSTSLRKMNWKHCVVAYVRWSVMDS